MVSCKRRIVKCSVGSAFLVAVASFTLFVLWFLRGQQPIPAGIIIPGLGVAECRIGQHVDELGDKFIDSHLRDSGYKVSPEDGIVAAIRNGRVETIALIYRPGKFENETSLPYGGCFSNGIGVGTSIEETIHQFHQPDSISVYHETSKDEEVVLGYVRKGVVLSFDDQGLWKIVVARPQEPVPWADQDLGDTAQYRRIRSRP